MGSVWLAQDTMLSRPVAVKVLRPEVAWRALSRTRFEREAKLAAQIRSRHVVQVLDHGSEGGLPFLVMELLEGESLRERLMRSGRLDIEETAIVVKHVCRALAHSHALGLVHRDIKPDNLFVCRDADEEELVIKVLDFGIAKLPDELAIDSEVATRTGAMVGTPFYVSPEQARGLKTVAPSSDLWSLGVVVFECLTGQRPFSASGMGPLIAKMLHAPIPRLAQVVPELASAPDIQRWLDHALERDPHKRFPSARAMSEAFMVAAGVTDSQQTSSARTSLDGEPSATADHVPSVEAATTMDATLILDEASAEPNGDGSDTVALDPGIAPPPVAGPHWASSSRPTPPALRSVPWPEARAATRWRAPSVGIALGAMVGLAAMGWLLATEAPARLVPSFPVVRVTERASDADTPPRAWPSTAPTRRELSPPIADDSRQTPRAADDGRKSPR